MRHCTDACNLAHGMRMYNSQTLLSFDGFTLSVDDFKRMAGSKMRMLGLPLCWSGLPDFRCLARHESLGTTLVKVGFPAVLTSMWAVAATPTRAFAQRM